MGILLSALLLGAYARIDWAWPLGFVALLPWLLTFERQHSPWGTLLNAWLMSVAFTASAFSWFGLAIGSYTQIGSFVGLAVLLVAAPLFQPQVIVFALAHRWASRRFGPLLSSLAAASAWVATEWCVPKLLGDTLGHGLYPSALLRQAASWGGVAGLTVALLLTNLALAAAWGRRREPALAARAWPWACAVAGPLLLLIAGWSAERPASEGPVLRMGLVQANWADVEQQRHARGSYEVVRDVLDTHYAMSYDAVERQKVDALLWSETTYPTTFGQPKSEAGAEFDREIVGIVNAAQVPLVMGTYDRDSAGEYNAAAFIQPGQGLLGMYRKTRLFPFTEYVPPWLDSPALRQVLPWLGTWKPGQGARVFPLRLRNGQEVPVLPLICLDDVDTRLALQGARLGAQAIVTMSNDAWFTQDPVGARLHHRVAAFRSIETGLPQFRVTTNGYSAIIDPQGEVVAGSRMGERTLVVGALPVGPRAPTPLVRWGDWVGASASWLLAGLALLSVARSLPPVWRRKLSALQPSSSPEHFALSRPIKVHLVPSAVRWLAGVLRVGARLGLLWMGVAVLTNEALLSNTLAQIRTFSAVFLVPELLAWLLLQAFSARVTREGDALVFSQGQRRLTLPLNDLASLELWAWPIPALGARIRLKSGAAWVHSVLLPYPQALATLAELPVTTPEHRLPHRLAAYAQALRNQWPAWRRRFGHPALKFVALPLLLSLPAFHLHQHIAYGSALGEYLTFGLQAYLTTLLLWWAAWSIGVTLWAAALRLFIEAGSLVGALTRPALAHDIRRNLETLCLAAMYLGLPLWLAYRVWGA